MEEIDGQEIEGARTLKTMYDQDSIAVTVDGKEYRIKIDQVCTALGEFVWTVEKKRKYKYLNFSHPWRETREEWLYG